MSTKKPTARPTAQVVNFPAGGRKALAERPPEKAQISLLIVQNAQLEGAIKKDVARLRRELTALRSIPQMAAPLYRTDIEHAERQLANLEYQVGQLFKITATLSAMQSA
jgi:hypothetical protein